MMHDIETRKMVKKMVKINGKNKTKQRKYQTNVHQLKPCLHYSLNCLYEYATFRLFNFCTRSHYFPYFDIKYILFYF